MAVVNTDVGGTYLLVQMQCGVEELLQHQRLQLRADEAQQLRQFRGRLAEIEAQLQADKRAAAADQDSWMSKTVSPSVYAYTVQPLGARIGQGPAFPTLLLHCHNRHYPTSCVGAEMLSTVVADTAASCA